MPFDDLKTTTPPGYCGYAGYPVAYQAAEFPALGRMVRITGSNQAFFFVRGVKNGDQVVDIEPNTSALNKLIHVILDQGASATQRPLMRLQIDADVCEDPAAFVDKYQSHRPEKDETARRFLLGKEAELIRSFIIDGGLRALAKKCLREHAEKHGGPAQDALENAVTDFFTHNFHMEGVRTAHALQFATWDITTHDGTRFAARQEYKDSTYMVNRPWQLGLEPQLSALAEKNHEGARQILYAVDYTRDLQTINLINFKQSARPAPSSPQNGTPFPA